MPVHSQWEVQLLLGFVWRCEKTNWYTRNRVQSEGTIVGYRSPKVKFWQMCFCHVGETDFFSPSLEVWFRSEECYCRMKVFHVSFTTILQGDRYKADTRSKERAPGRFDRKGNTNTLNGWAQSSTVNIR